MPRGEQYTTTVSTNLSHGHEGRIAFTSYDNNIRLRCPGVVLFLGMAIECRELHGYLSPIRIRDMLWVEKTILTSDAVPAHGLCFGFQLEIAYGPDVQVELFLMVSVEIVNLQSWVDLVVWVGTDSPNYGY